MIALFTGSVGSGKSYHALVEGLKRVYAIPKRYVIANFPLVYERGKRGDREKERWHFWEEITPEKLVSFSIEKGIYGKEGMCLIIIDEAGCMFNARDWQVKAVERAKWIKFFSQSRKLGFDVILVAQSDRMIDRQIRDLAEYEVRHFAMKRYWLLSWLPVRLHCAVWFWYHTKMKGTADPFIIRMKIAKKYDTMRLFNIDDMKKAIKALYQGKVVPAEVAKFLQEVEERGSFSKVCAGA